MSVPAFDALVSLFEGEYGQAAMAWLTSTGGLGNVIRYGQELGIPGRSILAAYRMFGGTIGDAQFWDLRRQVIHSQAVQAGLDLNKLISGPDIMRVEGGREGLYQVDFRVYVQHDAATGLPAHSVTNMSMTQRELNIMDAVAKMNSLLGTLNDPSDAYGRWIGFEVTHVKQYLG